MRIADLETLRSHYGAPHDRAVAKQLDRIDPHARRLIELSPFVVLATAGPDGLCDVAPRGDAPGFVAVEDERTLLLPDRPGNNRLDALSNILTHPGIGLLFIVPGLDETLRINGIAEIRDDLELRERLAVRGKLPATVLRITVSELYLHCGKAFMRSRLWDPASQVERGSLPSLGEMLRDQINWATAETQDQMVEDYKRSLY